MMQTEAYWENLLKRSLCRFLLLEELAKTPLHVYALTQAIHNACHRCCDPIKAMVYSTMKELLEGGLVKCREENTRGAAAASAGSLRLVKRRFGPPAGYGRKCCPP